VKQNVNIWQLVLSVLSLIVLVVASAFSVTEQVTRNEEKIILMKEEIDKTQAHQLTSEDKIDQKLDKLLMEIQDIKIAMERKQDRSSNH